MTNTNDVPADGQKYMAFSGLIQWTQAVIGQGRRVSEARDAIRSLMAARVDSRGIPSGIDPRSHEFAMLDFHTQGNFFAVAAYKLLEYKKWCRALGLFPTVDFSKIDNFSLGDIKDLRDMREHIVEYFQGKGRNRARWVKSMAGGKSDASSVVDTSLGGRLDWVEFAAAAEHVLPQLLAHSVPYPSR